jgi:hypothetical protein
LLRHTKLWLGVVIALAAPASALVPEVASASTSPSANWTQLSSQGPSAREGASLAYDSARGRTVLFGGNGDLSDTWEFDGTSWTQIQVAGPPARYLAPMVYDSARRVTVLFGGYGNGYLQDTWEWDGAAWTRRFTLNLPPARDWSAMTFDSKRHRVVLFGGTGVTSLLNDTWEYDGADWSQVTTAHSPSARRGMALAFDPIRGKTVLFGGEDSLRLSDTWEYDGTDWAPISLSSAPPARLWHSMAYDSALTGVVMFGGITNAGFDSATWIYDGASWQKIASTALPADRFWASMAFDSARSALVLFGGTQGVTAPPLGDTWSLLGTNTLPINWSPSAATSAPAARVFSAMGYDSVRGVTVLFGGGTNANNLADTWEWDGFSWSQRTPTTSPPDLVAAVMAYDTRRHVSVLFGGQTGAGVNSTATWEWDGTNWTQRSLAVSPPARVWAAMAYDSTRGRMVLFGGVNGNRLGDTWEFDGNTWVQMNPTSSPSARLGSAIAFDSARGRTVLFGGEDSAGQRTADTWQWDGINWTQMPTSTAPYARFVASMAFDSQRGKTVMFAGDHIQPYGLGDTNDTWEWDGAQWTRDWTSAAPAIRAGQTMSFDSRRDRMVMFGGNNAAMSPATLYGDTWELGTGTITPAGSPAMTVTPSSMEFGSVDVGAASSGHGYVVSSGTGPLVTSMSITGDFSIAPSTDCPNAPNPLASGSSCFVFVTFSPTAAGDRTGSLTFTGNVSGGSQSLPLHGVGVQQDFTISANPSAISMQQGGPNPSSMISTTVVGSAGTIALSAQSNDPGVTASFNPTSIAAGSSSTMTVSIANSVAPGYYGLRVFGTEGALSHYVDVTLQVIAPPNFTIAANPTAVSMPQGTSAGLAINTTAVGSVSTVSLSASVTPAGPTALIPNSIAAGDTTTLTISAGYDVAPGSYNVTVTGVEGSFTHSTTVTVTVTQKGIVNGGFETGDLTGWTATGAVSVVTRAHTGSYAARLGSPSPSANSTLSQTFTVPAAGGHLIFWYAMTCNDKVKNDWFTVTITDGVTGAVSTVQVPVCSKPGWTKVTANLSSHAGHFVTVTFVNHDDGNPPDPSYTLVDDVSFT